MFHTSAILKLTEYRKRIESTKLIELMESKFAEEFNDVKDDIFLRIVIKLPFNVSICVTTRNRFNHYYFSSSNLSIILSEAFLY